MTPGRNLLVGRNASLWSGAPLSTQEFAAPDADDLHCFEQSLRRLLARHLGDSHAALCVRLSSTSLMVDRGLLTREGRVYARVQDQDG